MAERDDQLIERFWRLSKRLDEHVNKLKSDSKDIVDHAFRGHMQDVKDFYNEMVKISETLERRQYKRRDILEKMKNRIQGIASFIPRLENQLENFYKHQQEQKQYEESCANNYSRMESRVREAENVVYSLDFKSARERINSIKQEIFNSRPMKREQKDVLVQRVFSALDKLNSRAKEEFEQRDGERRIKQAEWQKKLRESIKKMEEARLHTQISIFKDKDFLKKQEMNLFNVRPGKKEIEIKSSIRAKISDMEAKILSKEQRVRELDNKIRETRKKLD